MKYMLIVFCVLFGFNLQAECKLKPESVNLQWTAFKTSDKVAVSGTFNNIKLIQSKDEIVLNVDTSTVNTKNPARDITLKKAFFAVFNPSKNLKVSVPNKALAAGKTQTGMLKVSDDAKEFEVPVKVSRKGNLLSLNGTFDLKDVGHLAAWESIHKACKALHRGPDGVSKTWTQVDVSASAEIASGC